MRPAIGNWLLVAVGLAWGASTCAAQQPLAPSQAASRQADSNIPDARPADLQNVARLLLNYTNALRAEQGRRPLKLNRELQAAAADFAQFMARNDVYGHKADKRDPAQRVEAAHYEYCIVEENIAYLYNSLGFSTYELARQLFEGWRNSPEHFENLMNPYIGEIGIAVAQSTKSLRYYAVQDFGRPKSEQIVFELMNTGGEKLTYQVDGQEFTLEPRYGRKHMRCTPPTVQIKADEKATPVTLRPTTGERYSIRSREDGSLAIETGKITTEPAQASAAGSGAK